MTPERETLVAGGGLTGALLALRLAERGPVHLLDRRPDPRLVAPEGGRSINLAISTRGLDALSRVGLVDTVLAEAVPMRGRMMHAVDRHLSFQPYGTDPSHVLQAVDREALTKTMLTAVDGNDAIKVSYEIIVRDVNIKDPHLLIEREGGGHDELPFDALYGADGAYSTVRLRLQKTGRFEFSQTFLSHGYKELTIPPGRDGGYQIEPHALHIWPRGGQMMIALPNPDGSFTATLFWPMAGEGSFDELTDDHKVAAAFERLYPDVPELVPDLVDQYRTHPTSSLVTVRCGPWFHKDMVAILGDAAHAVLPFYGQGANAGMEDVTILCDALDAHPGNREAAFRSFYEQRKPHTDALADLAMENFVEMRDHVASGWFLFRQSLKRRLHVIAPEQFTPLYTLVTFTRTPYADAVRSGRRVDNAVDWLCITAVLVVLAVVLAVVLMLLA